MYSRVMRLRVTFPRVMCARVVHARYIPARIRALTRHVRVVHTRYVTARYVRPAPRRARLVACVIRVTLVSPGPRTVQHDSPSHEPRTPDLARHVREPRTRALMHYRPHHSLLSID